MHKRKQQQPILSFLTIAIMVAYVIVMLTQFGSIISAQAQVNASTITPEQKDAICNPNNPAAKLNPVNTTESKICGIPVTVKPHLPSSNMTTGAQEPPLPSPPTPATSIAPSATPPS